MKNEHDNERDDDDVDDDDDDDVDDTSASFVVFQFSFGSAAIRTEDRSSKSMMAVKEKVQ